MLTVLPVAAFLSWTLAPTTATPFESMIAPETKPAPVWANSAEARKTIPRRNEKTRMMAQYTTNRASRPDYRAAAGPKREPQATVCIALGLGWAWPRILWGR